MDLSLKTAEVEWKVEKEEKKKKGEDTTENKENEDRRSLRPSCLDLHPSEAK